MNLVKIFMLLSIAILILLHHGSQNRNPIVNGSVCLKLINGKYELIRNGTPYFIKGAAVVDLKFLHVIKECGGNSVRIYSTENAKEILDTAYKLGLSVTVGLYIKLPDSELDYSNDVAVKLQYEHLKQEVSKYKNHPALLMWGIGNEVTKNLHAQLSASITYIRLVKEINNVAKMIHEVDPNHPTTTMIPGGAYNIVRLVSMFCDQIDVLSMNSFDDKQYFQQKLEETGWHGPYLISEYGCKPYWLMNNTEWSSQFEQTSHDKSTYIRQEYENIMRSNSKCIGSYVFLWGNKTENTVTLFSLFTERNEATEVIECIRNLWTGNRPLKQFSSILSVNIDHRYGGENIYLKPGKQYTAQFKIKRYSPDLFVRWEIRKDNKLINNYQRNAVIMDDSLTTSSPTKMITTDSSHTINDVTLTFETPNFEGPFRLYLYLRNEQNQISTANECFYVHNF